MSDGATGTPMRLWDLLEWRVEQTPDTDFLSDDRDRKLTFAQFHQAAEGVAAWLHGEGVGEDTRVMWQLPTTLESAVLSLALARLGARQNPLIPMLRVAEISSLHEQFQPEFAIVPTHWGGFDHAEEVQRIGGPALRVITCDHGAVAGGLALPQRETSGLPNMPVHDGPRWVYVTTGSTAAPKGVQHTDGSLYATSHGIVEQFGLTSEDLFPIAYPYAHVGGVAWLISALRIGSALVLLDKFDPVQTPLVMAEKGATVLGSATPFLQACLLAQRAHGVSPLYPKLRLAMAGGSGVPENMDELIRTELGGIGVVNGYGLTECPISGFPPIDNEWARSASAFAPAPGVTVRVVTADGSEADAGQEGELRMDGPQKFVGYLDSTLDSDAFDEQGYVRTGDLATRDADGLIRITGRLKEIIVRNGENISIAEIENVLATHPAVADVAVVGLPDEPRGQLCCAVVVLADPAAQFGIPEIAEHCAAAQLAKYKVPEKVVFVASIPRNSMGKIQRAQIDLSDSESMMTA